tara:strand:- start:187 stop:906 length:720 start_codon:yes stop_codon:yes gene_type:complete
MAIELPLVIASETLSSILNVPDGPSTSRTSLLAFNMTFFKSCILGLGIWIISFGANGNPPIILVLGDSLSAAYQMPEHAGWVHLAQQEFDNKLKFINASVSGETTAGAKQALPRLLERYQPSLIIIEMGANDGLRGHAPLAIKSNLSTMIRAGLSNGAAIALIEMDIPANYGSAYRDAFRSIYRELSVEFNIILIPSVFDEIFGDPQLLQADELHPNQKAQILIKERVLSTLSKVLKGL